MQLPYTTIAPSLVHILTSTFIERKTGVKHNKNNNINLVNNSINLSTTRSSECCRRSIDGRLKARDQRSNLRWLESKNNRILVFWLLLENISQRRIRNCTFVLGLVTTVQLHEVGTSADMNFLKPEFTRFNLIRQDVFFSQSTRMSKLTLERPSQKTKDQRSKTNRAWRRRRPRPTAPCAAASAGASRTTESIDLRLINVLIIVHLLPINPVQSDFQLAYHCSANKLSWSCQEMRRSTQLKLCFKMYSSQSVKKMCSSQSVKKTHPVRTIIDWFSKNIIDWFSKNVM